jgi:cardiolipin synthase
MALRYLGILGLVLFAGCQPIPAHVQPCDGGEKRVPSRKGLFVRQIVGDTVVETGQHPLKEARALLRLPVDYGIAIEQMAIRRRFRSLVRRNPSPIEPCRPTLDPDALEEVIHKKTGSELQPAWVELYPTGEEALAGLHQLIDLATCRIDILMYLWDNDPLGWEVAHHLAAVATPDKPVRILIDGGANLNQGEPKEATSVDVQRVVCWLEKQPNIHLIRHRDPNFHMDHRKVVVADGRLAWSGGRNFTYPAFFKDRDVSYIVAGPLACQLEKIFEEYWQEQGGCPAPALPPPPPLPQENAQARLVETAPHLLELEHAVYHAIDRACHHIYMENPYLTDNRILLKLEDARRRGVDVRVVMTTSDTSQSINSANKVTMNRLLRGGVRVYHYPSMTHAKTTAVDGVWAYVGTGNFDRLSLRHNHEIGLAVGYGPLIQEIEERVFMVDFNPEWELKEPLPVSISDRIRAVIASLLL